MPCIPGNDPVILIKKFFLLLWTGWKKFAHVLGIVNTRILLSLSYILIFSFASIFPRLFGVDFLEKKLKKKDSYWHDREPEEISLETCRRQF
jgi:hypothetical protein